MSTRSCAVPLLLIPVLAATAGCGTVIEYRQEVDFLDQGDLAALVAGPNDCNTVAGYELDTYVAPNIHIPELHIIGINNAGLRDGRSVGEATIRVQRTGPLVLVLSALEATHWHVEVEDGALIEWIIATGYWRQSVSAPAGLKVTILDVATSGDTLGVAVSWPRAADSADQCLDFFVPRECELLGDNWPRQLQVEIEATERLVSGAESITGLELSTFNGCYDMSTFTLIDAGLSAAE